MKFRFACCTISQRASAPVSHQTETLIFRRDVCFCFEADIADDDDVLTGDFARVASFCSRGGHGQLRPRKNAMNWRRMTTYSAQRVTLDAADEVDTAKEEHTLEEGSVRLQRWKQVQEGSIRCWTADAERHLSTGSARIRSHVQRRELTRNKYRFASWSCRKSSLYYIPFYTYVRQRAAVIALLSSNTSTRQIGCQLATVVLRNGLNVFSSVMTWRYDTIQTANVYRALNNWRVSLVYRTTSIYLFIYLMFKDKLAVQ